MSNKNMQMVITAKQMLQKHRNSKSPFIRFGITVLKTSWNAFQTVRRLFSDKEFRSILLLKVLRSNSVHQTTPLTYMDRYPVIFSACRDYFDDKKNIKILSYGCSTGEEVLTLRNYFPNAQIIGAEINKHSLKKCRELPVDENITFIHSTPREIQKYGPFDAIFCMAVLQRQPHYVEAKGITSLKKIYPFEKFERQIVALDELVKEQGLLIVHFTQYSVGNTTIAFKYKPLGDYDQNDYTSPVFDKNSDLVKHRTKQNSIFIKHQM